MRDLYSTDLEGAAQLARDEQDFGADRPSPSEYQDEPVVRRDYCNTCGAERGEEHAQHCHLGGEVVAWSGVVPVTVEDFAPRGPVVDGADEDRPF